MVVKPLQKVNGINQYLIKGFRQAVMVTPSSFSIMEAISISEVIIFHQPQ